MVVSTIVAVVTAVVAIVIGLTRTVPSAPVAAAVYGALVAGTVSIVLAGLGLVERRFERMEHNHAFSKLCATSKAARRHVTLE